MKFLQTLSYYVCLSNSLYVYLPLLGLLFFKKKRLAMTTLVVVSTGMLVNAGLKLFFKVPLMPHLGTGYAFPSGHTQMTTIFFGWLAINKLYPKKYFVIIVALVGYSIYAQRYHQPNEIVAGFITGLLVLIVFSKIKLRQQSVAIILLNTILLTICFLKQYHLHFFFSVWLINFLTIFVYKRNFDNKIAQ